VYSILALNLYDLFSRQYNHCTKLYKIPHAAPKLRKNVSSQGGALLPSGVHLQLTPSPLNYAPKFSFSTCTQVLHPLATPMAIHGTVF